MRFLEEAEAEYLAALSYYDDIDRQLAEDLIRCTDEGVEQACELALTAYDPSGHGRVGLGGFGTSCGCGGAFMGGPHCDPLRERWRVLEASAPTLEDYALPSRVEDIAPEDSLEFE